MMRRRGGISRGNWEAHLPRPYTGWERRLVGLMADGGGMDPSRLFAVRGWSKVMCAPRRRAAYDRKGAPRGSVRFGGRLRPRSLQVPSRTRDVCTPSADSKAVLRDLQGKPAGDADLC
jgi:hypothetical protein